MENYVILEHVGEGSFGKVYKVWMRAIPSLISATSQPSE